MSRVTSAATGSVARRYSWTRRGGSGVSWTRKPSRRWWSVERLQVARSGRGWPAAARRASPTISAPSRVVADEGDVAAPLAAGRRLADVVQERRRSAAPCRGSSRRRAARRAAPAASAGALAGEAVEVGLDLERRSSTASVWPWTSRWWLGPCSTPRSAASSGSTTGGQRRARRAGRGRAAGRRRRSAGAARPAGARRRARPRAQPRRGRARRCRDRARSSSSAASRAARSRRSGSAAKLRAPTARRTRRSRSARPPCGSIGSPPASGTATAPTREVALAEVGLDRRPAQRGRRRPARPPSRATTRQVANSAESSKACPSPAAAIALAAVGRVAGDGEVEVGRPRARGRRRAPRRRRSRRRSRRRRAPRGRPRPPATRASRPRSRRSHSGRLARHPGGDPAGDLVVDRAEPARDLLGEDRVLALRCRSAPPRRRARPRCSAPRSIVTLSIETVPTSGWRRPPTSTSRVVGEAASDAVAVADRQHADPRLGRGLPGPPVAGASRRLPKRLTSAT